METFSVQMFGQIRSNECSVMKWMPTAYIPMIQSGGQIISWRKHLLLVAFEPLAEARVAF